MYWSLGCDPVTATDPGVWVVVPVLDGSGAAVVLDGSGVIPGMNAILVSSVRVRRLCAIPGFVSDLLHAS